MDKKMLGRKIKFARNEKELTGEQLAELCGINAAYLRQLESGAKSPSLSLFIVLCQKLNVSPSYLLSEALTINEGQEIDEILALWNQATPQQIKIISSMIKGALKSLENE